MAVSFQLVERASQSFTSADVKSVKSVFCRDMCVAENTLRGVLCRIVRFQRTTEAQNAANLSQKKRPCLLVIIIIFDCTIYIVFYFFRFFIFVSIDVIHIDVYFIKFMTRT